jgi:hypothetical protein
MMNNLTSFVKFGNFDPSCMNGIPPPDFERVTPAVQAIAQYLFG